MTEEEIRRLAAEVVTAVALAEQPAAPGEYRMPLADLHDVEAIETVVAGVLRKALAARKPSE